MSDELCACPRWLARAGLTDEHIRKVEARARMQWLCVHCRLPLLPYETMAPRPDGRPRREPQG